MGTMIVSKLIACIWYKKMLNRVTCDGRDNIRAEFRISAPGILYGQLFGGNGCMCSGNGIRGSISGRKRGCEDADSSLRIPTLRARPF